MPLLKRQVVLDEMREHLKALATQQSNPNPTTSPKETEQEEAYIHRIIRTTAFEALNELLQDAWQTLESEGEQLTEQFGETLWHAFGETIERSQRIMDVYFDEPEAASATRRDVEMRS